MYDTEDRKKHEIQEPVCLTFSGLGACAVLLALTAVVRGASAWLRTAHQYVQLIHYTTSLVIILQYVQLIHCITILLLVVIQQYEQLN